MELREDEPLSRHCTFRIGGPAPAVLMPRSAEELAALCGFLRRKGERPLLIGNGTNLLFPDEGIDRLVIRTCRNAGAVRAEGGRVTAECGALLSSADQLTLDRTLLSPLQDAMNKNAGSKAFRRFSVPSKAPHLIRFSILRRGTLRISRRSQKFISDLNLPPSSRS